jgi:glycosyltransferase involved in cell wall biosynthesis
MRVAIAVNWDKKKERTWSYTPFSLLTAMLKKQEITTLDWSLSPNFIVEYFHKLRHATYNPFSKKITSQYKISSGYQQYLQSQLREWEKKESADAVITIGDSGLALRTNQLTYTDCTTLEYMEMMNTPALRPFFQSIYSNEYLEANCKWQEELFPQQAGLVSMSKHAATYFDRIKGIDKSKVHVIPPGINVKFDHSVQMNRPIDKPYILFVGKEFHMKAGGQVIGAFELLRQSFPDIELVMIGPPDYERPASLPDGVHWLGFMDRSYLPAYFSHAEFLCVPSHIEAFGIVFAEALCYGLPVIARNAYAMPEIIQHGETGYLLPKSSTSYEELAELMKQVLLNSTMKQSVMSSILRNRMYYSWDRVADDFIRVIKSIG